MKCLILLVILAVAQYQEVTGAPQQVFHHMPFYEIDQYDNKHIEVEQLLETLLSSIRPARGINIPFRLEEALKHLSTRLEWLKKSYQNTMQYLEAILKNLDTNTKDYPTIANATSDNEPEVNATDSASAPNDSEKLFTAHKYSDKPLSRSLNPFSHLSNKIQSIKLIYQQAMKNFKDVISYLKDITKFKDTKEKLKPVSVPPNDEVETSTTGTSPALDGSVVNQPNANNEKELEDKKESSESTTIVNQVSTLSEDDVKTTEEEKDESNKESLVS